MTSLCTLLLTSKGELQNRLWRVQLPDQCHVARYGRDGVVSVTMTTRTVADGARPAWRRGMAVRRRRDVVWIGAMSVLLTVEWNGCTAVPAGNGCHGSLQHCPEPASSKRSPFPPAPLPLPHTRAEETALPDRCQLTKACTTDEE